MDNGKTISAEILADRFGLAGHVENGRFAERNEPSADGGRAASGAIYYYVAPDEYTKFHEIDCDEYWCYIKGSPLELWQIGENGEIAVTRLGIEEGCEPLVRFRRGVKFASRRFRREEEGTFLSCITVPRYMDRGFTLYEDEEIVRLFPAVKAFFTKAD